MKARIKEILHALIWLLSRIYTYNFNVWLRSKRNTLYTMWIQNFFGKVGDKSSIHYPCKLEGGGSSRISIGSNTCIHSHCILGCWESYIIHNAEGKLFEQHFAPEIIIGSNCSIGEYTQITSINKITIGDGLLTGRYVYIGDNSHGGLSVEESVIQPVRRRLKSKGEITIGNNVWVGDKVTILGGVTVGDNVIVGANSVVTHDLPSNSMASGVPAKVIKRVKECLP